MFIGRCNWRQNFKIILGNGFLNAAFDFITFLAEFAEMKPF